MLSYVMCRVSAAWSNGYDVCFTLEVAEGSRFDPGRGHFLHLTRVQRYPALLSGAVYYSHSISFETASVRNPTG